MSPLVIIILVLGSLALIPIAWFGLQIILFIFIKLTAPFFEWYFEKENKKDYEEPTLHDYIFKGVVLFIIGFIAFCIYSSFK